MGCSISHSRRKEKGRAYLEDALIAGNELGEDRTAAARSVVAATPPGRARKGSEPERRERKSKGGDERGP